MKQKKSIAGFGRTLTSVLLTAWYLLAVTGLDVHYDHEHGRTYVVSSLWGGDCEHIHPGTHCHDEDADAADHCLTDEDCCSDDFEAVLSPTELQDELRLALPDAEPLPFLAAGALPAPVLPHALRLNSGAASPAPPHLYLLKLSILRS